jgi:hypothetical protein
MSYNNIRLQGVRFPIFTSNRFYWLSFYFFAFIIILSACKTRGIMKENKDTEFSEPILFLKIAGKKMKNYHSTIGYFPKDWYLLDISFANGPCLNCDDDITPKKEMGRIWRPKNCDYTYEIFFADKDRFLVEAINQKGQIEYIIDETMEFPIKVEKN